MQVILLEDVKKLGKKGELVEVSYGYARNFLLPRGLAQEATRGRIRDLGQKKMEATKKKERRLKYLKQVRDDLMLKTIKIKAKAGEGGRLFGSVTTKDMAQAVKKKTGIDFERRWIQQKNPIKHIGMFQVPVRYAKGVEGFINIEVTSQEAE
ncbi:MAG: 50S ribosomal protein L9 [Candidatus Eremiobacteraeota bacterium]|nr:50S ribosomal protein L9 [Candidatus Eremiobacteraeota bacterium]